VIASTVASAGAVLHQVVLADVGGSQPWARGVLLVLGLGVAAESWALASRGAVPSWERSVFFAFNRLPRPVGVVLLPVMQLGAVLGGLAAGGVLGVLDRSVVTGAVLMGTVFVAWLVAKGVKSQVRRGRPVHFFDDAVLREDATDFGYVSGHMMVAVSLAIACGPAVPAWGELALLVACLMVGAGRLYVGAHLPLDVVGGAGLGIAAGSAGALVLDTLG